MKNIVQEALELTPDEISDLDHNICEIAKKILPIPMITINSDAIELVRNCMLEFASSLSHEASTKTILDHQGNRITDQSLLYGLRVLGYEEYDAPIKCYAEKRCNHFEICEICKAQNAPIKQKNRRPGRKPKIEGQEVTISEETGEVNNNNTSNEGNTTEKIKTKGTKRKSWTDPSFVEELQTNLIEALELNTDPESFLRKAAKDMGVPFKKVFQKYSEMKKIQSQSQTTTSSSST